jgi:hypothetical protein
MNRSSLRRRLSGRATSWGDVAYVQGEDFVSAHGGRQGGGDDDVVAKAAYVFARDLQDELLLGITRHSGRGGDTACVMAHNFTSFVALGVTSQ